MPSRAASIPSANKNRSNLSNNPFRLPGIDQQSTNGRRFKDLVEDIASDLGGVGALGPAQIVLVRQAALDVMRSETLHAAALRGETVDPEELTRAGNSATRTLNRLGVKHRPRDTSPSLAEYLAANHGEAP